MDKQRKDRHERAAPDRPPGAQSGTDPPQEPAMRSHLT